MEGNSAVPVQFPAKSVDRTILAACVGYALLLVAFWFVARLEGARSGGYLELGLRFLVSGDGGPGSMFLTPMLGGVGVSQVRFLDSGTTRGGLSLALGAEFRL